VNPDQRSFDPDPDRVARVTDYTRAHFAPHRPTGATDTCLYTNTPDEDFVMDRRGPIVIGSPCSGHGFKFTPLVGRILADLATGDRPSIPLDRFASTRPTLMR
jgi:sarcosine oxidase